MDEDELRKLANQVNDNEENFTDLNAACVGLNELYLSAIKAGFSERQALYVAAAVSLNNPGVAPSP